MGAAKPISAADQVLNLFDNDTFAAGHPHDAYDQVRATTPVYRHAGTELQPPFWALTRYSDIQTVSLDTENFTSTRGFRLPTDRRTSLSPEIGRLLGRFMLAMDRPEHDDFRMLVSSRFTPAALRGMEASIHESISTLMDSLAGRDEVDFVHDVGADVPIKTICAIFGLSGDDERKVLELTNTIFGTDDPDFAPTAEQASADYMAIFDYAGCLLEQRRKNPTDDLLSVIAHAEIRGNPITLDEQKSFVSNLLAAGNETTRTSLTGSILALAAHPDQRALLVQDEALLPGAMNELLRYVSPVFQMMRVAKNDVELDGNLIKAGERVVMLYGAGNHDPAMFENPHTLDIERENASKHLTFGLGVHHCLGNRLAILQLRSILSEFLRRYPNYEIVGRPAYVKNNFVGAIKSLTVKLNG